MEITSSAFEKGASIPKKYTCLGEDVSPPLKISNIPQGTKSLAIMVDDPDAPGGDWLHWLVWNIYPGTTEITEGVLPDGAIEGTNSFGNIGWGGPCPPGGEEHEYVFTLYALAEPLDLDRGGSREEFESAIDGLVFEKAELRGKFSK